LRFGKSRVKYNGLHGAKEFEMKYLIIALFLLPLITIIGCEGTGDSPFPSQGHAPGSETILAEGEFTIEVGADSQVLGSVEAPGEGLLVAVILWDGEPAELSISLKHIATDAATDATSTSPLAVTANVSDEDISAGKSWEVSVSNPGEVGVTATYKIAFLAQ
jgi:hypothetical protein